VRDGAGVGLGRPEIQGRLGAPSIDPEAEAGITIAGSHRYQADMNTVAAGRDRSGDEIAVDRDGARV
jgi:hypothetical protein